MKVMRMSENKKNIHILCSEFASEATIAGVAALNNSAFERVSILCF